jgi:D-alanyl-lipoteichoic acid acyltransferase DltB (MBOAT superfamily)
MLFHSPAFIFGFLPLCFIAFGLLYRFWGWQPALLGLAAASLVFYGQWGWALAGLLLGSILCNFAAARLMLGRIRSRRSTGPILSGAIAANLALLGYFKYANFLIDNVNLIAGASFAHWQVMLPVGISFYTFIQIGFLIEVHNRQVEDIRFGHYLLFGSFFPCITAGPIILQREMLPQFAADGPVLLDGARIATALTVFGIGLCKKLLLADHIAPFANAVFDGAAGGATVSTAAAWAGALAYTLQLYFDFSGYSDMALGIAFLFGLRLPLNFNSPLKACSIIDFWRRWHITMTRFFTNYVYSPLALAMMRRALRRSAPRPARFLAATALPIVVTFVLAGLWHGAGWTFVVFGLIHGLALAVNHGWREAGRRALPPLAGWLLTMTVVVTGLVFFRAADLASALALLEAMVGLAPAGTGLATGPALAWIALLGAIALGCPNTQELMARHWFSSDPRPEAMPARRVWLSWRPTAAWAIAGAILLAAALGSLSSGSVFLYYQF